METIEETLIDILFKYRTACKEHQYLKMEEREKDRTRLNEIYEKLHTIHQKILDSQCYSQLGALQKEQTQRFLADEIEQRQRLAMLAYIVRSAARPVLFLAGKSTLLVSPPEIENAAESKIEILPPLGVKPNNADCACLPVDYDNRYVEEIAFKLKKLVDRYKIFARWQQKLNLHEAELLSQMVASGEIEIQLKTRQKELEGKRTSIILKEALCQT